MASTAFETKALEANERQIGNGEMGYRKKGDGFQDIAGSGNMEMTSEVPMGEDDVDPEVLQHAIEALEKKTAWYAYLTTWDFWLVLLIGFVLLYCSLAGRVC